MSDERPEFKMSDDQTIPTKGELLQGYGVMMSQVLSRTMQTADGLGRLAADNDTIQLSIQQGRIRAVESYLWLQNAAAILSALDQQEQNEAVKTDPTV